MVLRKLVPSGTDSPSSPPNNPPKRLFPCLSDYFVKSTLMSLTGDLNSITISVGGKSDVSPFFGKDETIAEWAFAAKAKTDKWPIKDF